MKKQTAIDWLVEEMRANWKNVPFDIQISFLILAYIAKGKEKEQIVQAHYEGGLSFQNEFQQKNAEVPYINEAVDYYNSNYNQSP